MPISHVLIVLAFLPIEGTIRNLILLLIVLMVAGVLLGFRVPGLS